jgi:methionyl-tRNA synthetase
LDQELRALSAAVPTEVETAMEKLELPTALAAIWKLIGRANKYIDETTPWVLAKEEKLRPRLQTVLYNLAETMRIIGLLLVPFLIDSPEAIWTQLGLTENIRNAPWEEALKWGVFRPGTKVKQGKPIFPRIDVDKMLLGTEEEKKVAEKEAEKAGMISIEDFARVELRVAEVLAAEKVEKSNKLLKLQLQVGEEQRQVVSGIAKHVAPEDLVGQKVVVVTNLKPAKLMGLESQGMILAAGDDAGNLSLLTVAKDIASGSKIT